jgi:hypothetical protein
MTTSAPAAYRAASTPQAPSTRLRYTLLCNDGYLLACHGPYDCPVTVVPEAERATSFVDWATAARRAVALQKLGWEPLQIVPFYLCRS